MIAASRRFVCARLLTYESAEEEAFLEGLFRGRSGDLENTTFAILAPDGTTRLSRTGRGPGMVFGRGGDAAKTMAAEMQRIAKKHPGRKNALDGAPLPRIVDVRRAINVAACDNLPLVIVVAKDVAEQRTLEARLAPLAWHDANMGRFLYVSTTDRKELAPLGKVKPGSGYVLVQPDAYGRKGERLVQVPASATAKTLQAALTRAGKAYQPLDKSHHREHVRDGKREGVHWETEIPVTDPGRPPHGKGPPGR